MYGTVARIRLKPGAEQKMMALMDEFRRIDATVSGFRGEVVIRSDSDPLEHFLAVVFDSEEAYRANAADPAQHERYQRYRALLAAEPEWHDGQVVYANL